MNATQKENLKGWIRYLGPRFAAFDRARQRRHWINGHVVVPILRFLCWYPAELNCRDFNHIGDWRQWLRVFDARTGEDLQSQNIFRANRVEGWYDRYVFDADDCPMANPDNPDELLTERVYRPIRFEYSRER